MNYLWGGMLLTGIVYGVLTGNVKDITDAVLASSREAIMLCFTMFGIVAFWSGLMEVAVDAGIMKGMTKLLILWQIFWGLAGRQLRRDFGQCQSLHIWKKNGES